VTHAAIALPEDRPQLTNIKGGESRAQTACPRAAGSPWYHHPTSARVPESSIELWGKAQDSTLSSPTPRTAPGPGGVIPGLRDSSLSLSARLAVKQRAGLGGDSGVVVSPVVARAPRRPPSGDPFLVASRVLGVEGAARGARRAVPGAAPGLAWINETPDANRTAPAHGLPGGSAHPTDRTGTSRVLGGALGGGLTARRGGAMRMGQRTARMATSTNELVERFNLRPSQRPEARRSNRRSPSPPRYAQWK